MLVRTVLRQSRATARLGASVRPYSIDGKPKEPPPPQSSRPFRAPGKKLPSGDVQQKSAKKHGGAQESGAAAAASGAWAKTPVDGTRPVESGSRSSAQSQEPLAQQNNADEPPVGSLRDQTQKAQAQADNAVEQGSQDRPLPDLRQGLPSTFDLEFGQGKEQGKGKEQSDVEPAAEEAPRDRGEREYKRADYETSLDRQWAQMARWLSVGIVGSLVAGGLYLARPFREDEEPPTGLAPENAFGWGPGAMYERTRARMGRQLGHYTEPTFPKLLPDVPEDQRQPYTLVLSLEDLLVHSTWDRQHGYRIAKRPGFDYFVRYLSQYYELVLFTSVPLAMADPVMKKLDPYHFIMWPLGREATKYEAGEHVKDLSYLNRPLSKTVIVDTHAPHVQNQPENAIILPKWTGEAKDPHAKDLVALIPFLEHIATMGVEDVRDVLKSFEGKDIAIEFAAREAKAREEFNRKYVQERKKKSRLPLGSLASALGLGSSTGAGGMVLADGQSVAEGLEQGKMLSDQIREQGQKQYERLEQQIREKGAQWLKEEEEEQKRMMEAQMRDMKKGAFSWLWGGK
ncbi:HAD-like protein [Piedraia hortae CBS 480.64]|uniref:Mitochondrial import inner membrane translocase subunit TIM50 n=1 Tax=Piedraia hortae CBS 480.64 TaxID=1314780 RepID=A0A6A7C7H7_9PEZI|nr:HAD-like protein [Piedraia hortae CBS 480.64]